MASARTGIHVHQQFEKLYQQQKEATHRAEFRWKRAALQHNREVKEVLSSKHNVQQLSDEIVGLEGHKKIHS